MKPPPIEIVVDTREQAPLAFDVPTRRGTLATGDYSLTGHEAEFTVERKSLNDLVGTVIHDRERFCRELERMRDYRFRRIVVVAPYAAVERPYAFSAANPRSVIASLNAFEMRYGVPVVFCANPGEAARRIADWARYFARERLIEQAPDADDRQAGRDAKTDVDPGCKP